MTPELIARWAREDRERQEREQAQEVAAARELGAPRRAAEADEALKQRLSTSYGRFGWRIEKWKRETGSALPHHFWWFVHNCVAHPAIGLVPVPQTFAFHDYTSKKINRE